MSATDDRPTAAPADIETASAAYAARFAGPAGRYMLTVQEQCVRELIASYRGGSILEIGGGHGQLLALYARLAMQVTLHGSNRECFARLCAQQLAGVRPLSGDFMHLDVPDRSHDIVLAVRLLAHVQDRQGLLSEMARIARHAVIVDYPSIYSANALTPLLFPVKKRLEGNTRTYLSFSRRQLEREFSHHGLSVIRQRKQFLLPMVLHRAGQGNALFQGTENMCRRLGLTALLGSPVIMQATRPRLTSPAIGGRASSSTRRRQ
ncbi:MAG: methyltransferase domain-containing protein [Aquisalimonadaceae bacterium]